MKKTFTYEYKDGRSGSLSYEVSLEEDERLETRIEDGFPTLYTNRSAMMTLAKLLIKLANGPYVEQFHVHLKRNFGEGPDALTVMLYPDDVPADIATTQKRFVYEYESDPQNRITFDYSAEADEKLNSSANEEGPVLYMNRPGMLTLAKILIKMAEGNYKKGFHVHLRQDFNADSAERITVILSPDDAPV